MDDDLVAKYAAEAKAAMEAEAARRVAEATDPEEEERLRNMPLRSVVDTDHLVPALLSRLGAVRAPPRSGTPHAARDTRHAALLLLAQSSVLSPQCSEVWSVECERRKEERESSNSTCLFTYSCTLKICHIA